MRDNSGILSWIAGLGDGSEPSWATAILRFIFGFIALFLFRDHESMYGGLSNLVFLFITGAIAFFTLTLAIKIAKFAIRIINLLIINLRVEIIKLKIDKECWRNFEEYILTIGIGWLSMPPVKSRIAPYTCNKECFNILAKHIIIPIAIGKKEHNTDIQWNGWICLRPHVHIYFAQKFGAGKNAESITTFKGMDILH